MKNQTKTSKTPTKELPPLHPRIAELNIPESTLKLPQNTHEELESRIKQQSANLAKVNAQLQDETTRRKRAEETLWENQRRYTLATSAGQVGVWDWNLETDDIYLDPSLKARLGYADHEIPNQFNEWHKFVHPDDVRPVMKKINSHLAGETAEYEIARRMLHKDGSIRWFLARGTAIRNKYGKAYRMIGTDTDVTARIQAEEAERQQRRVAEARMAELEALRQISLTLTRSLNLQTVLDTILESIFALTPSIQNSHIFLYQSDQLTFGAALWENGLKSEPFAVPRPQGLTYTVAQGGQPIIAPDLHQHPLFTDAPEDWKGAIVGLPLKIGDRVVGVMNVSYQKSRVFSESELHLLHLLADQAAIAIENARLYEQAQQDAQTRATLLREVNHRVKNNLSAIIGLLFIQQRLSGVKNETAYQAIMQDLIGRIQGMATTHRLLSDSDWAPLSASELIAQIIRASLQMVSSDKEVEVDVPPAPFKVTPKQASALALIVNELATNTIKHGLSEQDTPKITMRVVPEEENWIRLIYKDNGPGYPEQVLRSEAQTVGLYLIRTIVYTDLHGEFALCNDQGAMATIRFMMMGEDR